MLLGRDKPRCLLAILELLSHGRLWIKVRNAHPGKDVVRVGPDKTSGDCAAMTVSCHEQTKPKLDFGSRGHHLPTAKAQINPAGRACENFRPSGPKQHLKRPWLA
jgi:hypothetical protein